MRRATLIIIAFSVVLSASQGLESRAELSYASTSGNSSTESFAMELDTKKDFKSYWLSFDFEALYSKQNSKSTKNRWSSRADYDANLNSTIFFNYQTGYKKDKFSGYSYQLYTGPGLLYKIVNSDEHLLDLRGNTLYAKDKFERYNITKSYIAWKGEVDYSWHINSKLEFIQKISMRSKFDDSKNYFINLKTALEVEVSRVFFLGISYKIDYKNIVSEGNRKSDKVFLASLIAKF